MNLIKILGVDNLFGFTTLYQILHDAWNEIIYRELYDEFVYTFQDMLLTIASATYDAVFDGKEFNIKNDNALFDDEFNHRIRNKEGYTDINDDDSDYLITWARIIRSNKIS